MASVQNIEVKVLAFATNINNKEYGCDFQQVEVKDAYIFTGKNDKGKTWKYVTARIDIVNPKINKIFEDISKAISNFQPKTKQSFEFDFDVTDKEITQGQSKPITNLFLTPSGELQNTTNGIAIIPLERLVIGLASQCLKKETPIAKTICKFIQTNKAGKIIAEGEWIVTFFNQLRELVSKKHSVTQETV